LLDDAQGQLGCAGSQTIAVLVDAGEWYFQQVIIVHVSATDHGDIFGDLQTSIQYCSEGAHGDGIVIAKHSVRPGLELQQFLHAVVAGGVAGIVAVAIFHDVLRWQAQTTLGKRNRIPGLAVESRAYIRATDMCNSFASHFNEVVRGYHSSIHVVNSHEIRGDSRKLSIE